MFRLNIESSKDISELNIKFSDGEVTTVTSGEYQKTLHKFDDDIPLQSEKEVLRPPVIQENKTVNVAPEVHNLDI